MTSLDSELLPFFKALADPIRLQIVGLLARQSHSAEQLLAELQIKPNALAHHLQRLTDSGWVTAEVKKPSVVYTLRLDQLYALAGRVAAKAPPPPVADDATEFDRKVLLDFLQPDGIFSEIPQQTKKFLAVLRHVVRVFTPDQHYTEKEVKVALAKFYSDVACLRRGLIDFNLLERTRDGREYWMKREGM